MKKYTSEQLASARRIRSSQAIEGWERPLEETIAAVVEVDESEFAAKARELAQMAEERALAEGRDELDVLEQLYDTYLAERPEGQDRGPVTETGPAQ